jgi:glutamate carboxypeptidase
MKGFSLDEYLKDLAYVMSIDTGNFNGEGTNAVADFFIERYRALGLVAEKKYRNGFTAAPFVTVRNSDSERIDVMMIAHMDTVFPVGEAAARPMSIDGQGRVRGPGCADCKGGCVSMYYLIKSMLGNGEVNFNFCVCMNSDEEKGSVHSREFIEELAEKADRCLIFEPGRPAEEYVDTRKSGANYHITVHGIAAHSGTEPEKGASAIVELARWVVRLQEFFDLEEGTTVNFGRFDGGKNNGQVPDFADMTVSLRCLLPERADMIDRTIHEMAAAPFNPRCTVEVETVSRRPAMFPHEKTKAFVEELRAVGRELDFPIVTIVTGGGSDGNFIAHHGVATIDGCGPSGGSLHTVDEYMIKDTVEKRLDVMRALLMRVFAVKD